MAATAQFAGGPPTAGNFMLALLSSSGAASVLVLMNTYSTGEARAGRAGAGLDAYSPGWGGAGEGTCCCCCCAVLCCVVWCGVV